MVVFLLSLALLSAPQTAAERTWTCEILRDLGREAEAGFGDDPPELFLFANTFSTPHRAQSFSEFLDGLNDRCELDMCGLPATVVWRTTFEHLSLEMVQTSWRNYAVGGQFECDNLTEREWISVGDAQGRYETLMQVRRLRAQVLPNHPDYLPIEGTICGPRGEDIPRMILIQISRPAFNRRGDRALFVQAGSGIVMHRSASGRWFVSAEEEPQIC